MKTEAAEIDPVTLEVVRSALVAYADEMAAALCATAYNMMIFEVRDYCVGIVGTDIGIVAQNTGGLPIFLADLGAAIQGGVAEYGLGGFDEGDVVVSNDPVVCGQHLNNVVVFTPFVYDGVVRAFPAVRAHWVDIGGSSRGFGSMAAREIYEEGLQICGIKVYKKGEPNDEALRLIRDNIRFPDSSFGDLRGQIAACRLGERRLRELYDRWGPDTVAACIAASWDHDERLARAAISRLPDGDYEAESFLDHDYVDRDRKVPVPVKVTIAGETMTIDLSGLPPQVKGPINSGVSGGIAAARVAFKCVTLPHAPVTEGGFRPLSVVLPPGTFLSAQKPAALGGWSLSLPTVIDTILRALAPALPERITAGHKGDMSGYALYGHDAERGRPFINMNIFGGGWGAKPHGDGESAVVSVCQGNVRNAPVEVQEAYYPVFIEHHELRTDSGGPGRERGGLGVELAVRGKQDLFFNSQFQRTRMPPWGLAGGHEAAPNEAFVVEQDGGKRNVVQVSDHRVSPSELVVMRTGGGGGFGAPHERAADRVAEDVRRGYVSVEAAKAAYGVVVDPETFAVDDEATRTLRGMHDAANAGEATDAD
ncbi:MAG: hydantoinase B/oxoprolinase family protein [Rhodospirillales bacterium]|jgi:N-methylhydantoinase B|nr:hydantoinase B/oxoprolinase family protein [Rhodospirillales bacterium]